SAGTWTVTVTDANGCTASQNFTITQPATALGASTVVESNVTVNGGSDGSVTINITGGTATFEYTINGTTYSGVPDSSLYVSGLAAGTYPITVIDVNGCTATTSVTITEPAACTLTASMTSQTNIACNGGATGSLTVAPTGGTAPYSYLWNDSAAQATATATGLSAGAYSVTITDANGCTATATATITQPAAALNLTPASQTNIACNGGSTG
ncbi:SprB repeat-containing protein, partial [Flavobacterium rhizosphaerae]